MSKSKERSRCLMQRRKEGHVSTPNNFIVKKKKITEMERRSVVKALHDINGMEETSFADYVKNLLKDGDGRTTQRHIDAVRRGQLFR